MLFRTTFESPKILVSTTSLHITVTQAFDIKHKYSTATFCFHKFILKMSYVNTATYSHESTISLPKK